MKLKAQGVELRVFEIWGALLKSVVVQGFKVKFSEIFFIDELYFFFFFSSEKMIS